MYATTRTQSDYVDIAVPVLEEGTGRFVGVVSALVDISGLFSTLGQRKLGRTGRVLLVKGSGIIVNAPNVTPDLRLLSEEFTAVRDALGTPEGRQAGYVTVAMRNGGRIVAFADTGLKRSQPNLDWLILVSQSEREALEPVRTLEHFAFSDGCAWFTDADHALGIFLDASGARVGGPRSA